MSEDGICNRMHGFIILAFCHVPSQRAVVLFPRRRRGLEYGTSPREYFDGD